LSSGAENTTDMHSKTSPTHLEGSRGTRKFAIAVHAGMQTHRYAQIWVRNPRISGPDLRTPFLSIPQATPDPGLGGYVGAGGYSGDFTASESGFRTPQISGHEKVLRNGSRMELRGCKYHQNAQQNEPDATGGVPGPERGPKNFRFLVRNLPVKSPPPSTITARCKPSTGAAA
jgi:hypothetical protein